MPQEPDLGKHIGEWWKENCARAGFWPTLRVLLHIFWQFARDSMPSRRRRRYGDMDFDWDFRVDTTSATVSWRDRLLGEFHSAYQPTEPEAFHAMLSAVDLDLSRLTFLDLGSGKGRTLLMAADYPFRRVMGVELLPALHRIAQENIEKYQAESQKCFTLEAICCDAREFVFPPEPLLVYLFNPLPELALRKVVANLERSLAEHPRAVCVLYHNALLEHVVAESKLLHKAVDAENYALYVTDGPAAQDRMAASRQSQAK
ncbi:MAG: class I SAM-dependent methyltransferase [Acidobacteria bacterium]|nr:class I SAM-dependent methyltransferase [Acidobacteriota bacterium]